MGLREIMCFSPQGWKDSSRRAERSRWCCERLEDGDILVLPHFPLIDDEDRTFLTGVRQAGSSLVKNIPFQPARARLRGHARSATDASRLQRVLRDYSERAHMVVGELLSQYGDAFEIDLTSFRPLEEQVRPLRGRSRNDLIHIDSFPTRPARGRRILRFFTNVHPAKPRVWNVAQGFDELAASMALEAGLIRYASGGGLAGGLRKALTSIGRGAGISMAERAPYDRFMLHFHDYLKANALFQRECPKHRYEFPAGSSWVAFTDTVSHAVLSGQFALEQTFFVPVSALIAPHKSPLRILESLAHCSLT
jgi:3-deoxy-D-manno-oct-2-ulosonic acid (Kdo) hydroxylase